MSHKNKKSSPPSTSTKPSPKKKESVSSPQYQKILSRCVTIFAVLTVVYFTSKNGKEITFAKQNEILRIRSQNLDCSDSYKKELKSFPGCMPEKCGRFVSDGLVTAAEADSLLNIAHKGISYGGSDGGASILDLHTGALSRGRSFVNVYSLENTKDIFNKEDLTTYKVVKTKIQHAIGHNFGVDSDKIYLTNPTFFSQIHNREAVTLHDEYWHPHVDKETYKSFHYTSLLYLNDFGKDFQGGRFIFVDKDNVNSTIEPRKARVSMFTSGAENLHFVEKVTSGIRYALTVSFTCDPAQAIADPTVKIVE